MGRFKAVEICQEVRLRHDSKILKFSLPGSFKIDLSWLWRCANPIRLVLNIIGFKLIFLKFGFDGLFIQIRHFVYVFQRVNIYLAFLRIR